MCRSDQLNPPAVAVADASTVDFPIRPTADGRRCSPIVCGVTVFSYVFVSVSDFELPFASKAH